VSQTKKVEEKSCVHDENDTPPKIPICYFCEKEVTEDTYCFGCKHYVCEDCDQTPLIAGPHNVDEHQQEDEDGKRNE